MDRLHCLQTNPLLNVMATAVESSCTDIRQERYSSSTQHCTTKNMYFLMVFTKRWIGRAAYVRVQYPVNCETLHTIFPIIQYVVSYVRTYEFMCTKSIIQNSTHFYSRNSGTVGNVGKTKGIIIHCSGCAHVRIWAKLSTCIYTHMNMCQILTVHNSQCWNAQILWGLPSYGTWHKLITFLCGIAEYIFRRIPRGIMGIINSRPQSARRLPTDFRTADRMYLRTTSYVRFCRE